MFIRVRRGTKKLKTTIIDSNKAVKRRDSIVIFKNAEDNMKLDNNNKEILNSQNSGKYVNFNKGNVLKRSGFMLKPGLNLKKFQS